MRFMNRREAISGVLGIPLSVALPPLGAANCSLEEGVDTIDTLNVLFHGPFAFVLYPDHIRVLTPSEGDHDYKAGNYKPVGDWTLLKTFSAGTYSISGIKGNIDASGNAVMPNNRPDSATNVILPADHHDVKVTAIDPGRKHYATIILPFPRAYESLCLDEVAMPIFKGGAATLANNPKMLPRTQALTYEVSHLQGLQILGLPAWKATASPSVPNVANLHFVVLPKDLDGQDIHAKKAFGNEVKLFSGLNLNLDTHGKIGEQCHPGQLPLGVDAYESAGPARRPSEGGPLLHCRAKGLVITNAPPLLK
jgi:hypothetical protein